MRLKSKFEEIAFRSLYESKFGNKNHCGHKVEDMWVFGGVKIKIKEICLL